MLAYTKDLRQNYTKPACTTAKSKHYMIQRPWGQCTLAKQSAMTWKNPMEGWRGVKGSMSRPRWRWNRSPSDAAAVESKQAVAPRDQPEDSCNEGIHAEQSFHNPCGWSRTYCWYWTILGYTERFITHNEIPRDDETWQRKTGSTQPCPTQARKHEMRCTSLLVWTSWIRSGCVHYWISEPMSKNMGNDNTCTLPASSSGPKEFRPTWEMPRCRWLA